MFVTVASTSSVSLLPATNEIPAPSEAVEIAVTLRMTDVFAAGAPVGS